MHVPNFSHARILVVGDVMLDRYWYGQTRRVSPEAPVPVVHIGGSEDRLGGAANVAQNLAVLGARASLLGFCGTDESGAILRSLLDQRSIRSYLIKLRDVPTISKLRIISQQQQLIRLDMEDELPLPASPQLMEQFAEALDDNDIVVCSDYAKGTLATVEELIREAKSRGKTVLVDPKGKCFAKYRGADLIKPNLTEFEEIVGPVKTEEALFEKGAELMARLELGGLLVTRGEHGMTLLRRDHAPLTLPTKAQEVYDVTGAGDTVIAVLAATLGAGRPWEEATALANVAAGVVVSKMGTSTLTPAELKAAVHPDLTGTRGVLPLGQLLQAMDLSRGRGEKIVLTNGCFDILHPGHIDYLQEARSLGDRLIVLVNSDESIRRLKGPNRPVNTLTDRMAMLAALECVDWVIPFDEDTPAAVIDQLGPDILVKGGDYHDVTSIAGHASVLAAGGEVKVLKFLDGYSTTQLIDRIRAIH